MSRLSSVTRAQLAPEGQEVWDTLRIRDGSVIGPYPALIRVPELAAIVRRLSNYLRHIDAFDRSDLELTILATTRACGAPWVFDAHVPKGLEAGIRAEAIEAVRSGSLSELNPRERVIVEVCEASVRDHRLNDALYARAAAEFSEQTLIKLIALVGYYSLVAMVMGAFDTE